VTKEDRENGFLREMQASAERYGVRVEAVPIAEQLGPVIQVRSQIVVTALPDWVAPIVDEQTNGKIKVKE
jgi:hypothetical protein